MTFSTFTLTSAATQAAAPFSLGHTFKQGDVPTGSQVVAPFADFQCTPKNAWPDGSLKFAALSGRVGLTSTVPLSVALSIGTPTSGTALTTADLKATGAVATIGCGAFGAVSWATIDWDSPFLSWVSGPKMSSWIYRKAVGSDPHLVAWLEVRLWSGGEVEVLPWIENGYIRVAGPTNKSETYTFTLGGTQRFSGAINLFHHARTVLVSGALLSHWLASDPGVVVKHDATYWKSTALVPNLVATVSPSSSLVTTLPATYTPLQQGGYSDAMGQTGYQNAIGLLPQWDALYLTSSAPSIWSALQRNAYSAGRFPIHYRDENTNRPLRFDQFTHFSINASTTSDYPPAATGGGVTGGWDVAHHPSIGFMAYQATARWYHMETLLFAATVNYVMQVDDVRQFAGGVFFSGSGASTTRGAAWAVRTLGQAVTAIPDADTALRTNMIASLEANVNFNHGTYVAQTNNPFGIVTPYGDAYGTGSDGMVQEAAWQQNFYTTAFGYIRAMSLPISSTAATKLAAFFEWKAKQPVGMLGGLAATDWLYRDATPYTMVVAFVDFPDWAGGTGPWPASWGAMYTATTGAANSGVAGDLRGGNFPNMTSYWGNLTPAIAYAVQHNATGATAAYARMTGAANYSALTADFANGPEWSVQPLSTGASLSIATIPMGTVSMLARGQVMSANRTFGLLASEIPTGYTQPHPLLNDVDSSDPVGTRYAYEVTTVPAGLTDWEIQQNGGIRAGGPDGLHVGVQTTKKSGARTTGVALNIQIGAVIGGDTTPPTMNGGITQGATTGTSLGIGWAAGSDNIGVAGYKVSKDNGATYLDVGLVYTYTFPSLVPSTAYQVKVEDYDAAGNICTTPLAATFATSAASGGAPYISPSRTVTFDGCVTTVRF